MEFVYYLISVCMIAAFFYISRQLEENRKELELLRQEAEKSRAVFQHFLLVNRHPDLSDTPIFELDLDGERTRTSSFGEMLATAKERARIESRLR